MILEDMYWWILQLIRISKDETQSGVRVKRLQMGIRLDIPKISLENSRGTVDCNLAMACSKCVRRQGWDWELSVSSTRWKFECLFHRSSSRSWHRCGIDVIKNKRNHTNMAELKTSPSKGPKSWCVDRNMFITALSHLPKLAANKG
jgi:hypothetical protein